MAIRRGLYALTALVTALLVYVVLGGDVFNGRHLLVFSVAFVVMWLGADVWVRRWTRRRVVEEEGEGP